MNFIVLENDQYQSLLNKIDFIYQTLSNPAITNSGKKEEKLLTTKEAAQKLKVCSKTIINKIEAGEIKAIKYNKGESKRGHFKISTSEIERFIKTKRLGY